MPASTLDRVIDVIVRATGVSPDTPFDETTPLVGSGVMLDSVAVLQLLVGFEKEFDVEINVDELMSSQALETVGTLVNFIDSRIAAAE